MNSEIPRVFVSKNEEILPEINLQFEFAKFESYENKQKISAELEVPELDVIW